jgi:hypothetical protein
MVLALCGALAACDFELVDPPPPPPPLFIVSVRASQTDSTQIFVQALLQVGVDSLGHEYRLSDSTLSINGEKLPPPAVRPRSNNSLSYTWSVTRLGPPPPTFDVALPSFVSVPPLHLVVPVASRTDPYHVRLNPGEDLVLHVTSVAGDSTQLRTQPYGWQLTLQSSCDHGGSTDLRILGTTSFPSEVRVPRALIGGLAAQPFEACLLFQSLYSTLHTVLPMSAYVASDIRWRVDP